MGHRVCKRVALDFEWPKNKVWKGYVNPHWKPCKACDGRGETPGRRALTHLFHRLVIAADESIYKPRPGDEGRRAYPHPWLRESMEVYKPEDLTPDIDELVTALAGKKDSPLGRDTYVGYLCLQKLIEAAGLDPKKWGFCTKCDPEYHVDPEHLEAYKAWEDYEPPAGEGYQLWETTSEGSPISPVFKTARALAKWAAKSASLFANSGASEAEWLRMIEEDTLDVGSLGMMNTSTGEMGSAKDLVLNKPPPEEADGCQDS
jgi:hypothetical protein